MTVYQPKNSPYWHYDFQWKGRRHYGSTGMTSKRQALAVEARVRSDTILSLNRKPVITLDEACGHYQNHAEALPSWETVRPMMRALLAGIGKDRLLSEIGQRDLQTHFAKRRDGRKNASVNREIVVCRAIWRRAADSEYEIGTMPKWRALFLKVAETAPRELTFEEEPRLFAEMRADIVSVVDFALKSGWRLGEVIGLRWSDFDLGARQASTKIKGGNTVRRPLTPTLIALINSQPKVGPFVFTYVAQRTKLGFVDKLGRKQPARLKGQRYPMTETALRKPFAAAKKAGGVEGFRFHDLRHTRGTRIVRATGSLAAAKEALKHTSIQTTLRYAHVLDDDVRNALDASESRTIPEQATDKKAKA